jgi:hypothetical protein
MARTRRQQRLAVTVHEFARVNHDPMGPAMVGRADIHPPGGPVGQRANGLEQHPAASTALVDTGVNHNPVTNRSYTCDQRCCHYPVEGRQQVRQRSACLGGLSRSHDVRRSWSHLTIATIRASPEPVLTTRRDTMPERDLLEDRWSPEERRNRGCEFRAGKDGEVVSGDLGESRVGQCCGERVSGGVSVVLVADGHQNWGRDVG